MEKPLEDTGREQAPYMINALPFVITEENFSQTNASQDVENQHRDGNIQTLFPWTSSHHNIQETCLR